MLSRSLELSKSNNDTLRNNVISSCISIIDAKSKLNLSGTPLQLIDSLLENGRDSDARSIAKIMKMNDNDLLWRMVSIYKKSHSYDLAKRILSMMSGHDIILFFEYLKDNNLDSEILKLKSLITDSKVINALIDDGILNKTE